MIAPLTMTVRNVLFVHWPVSPAIVRSHLPASFTLETYDGKAWLGIVALRIENLRPRSVPAGLSFPQLNVRTYVTYEGNSGVYFFTLDADDPLGVSSTVARLLFRLPYYRADIRVQSQADSLTFRSHRTHRNAPALDFVATYGSRGDTFQAEDGSLSAYLTERYRLYVTDDRGRSYTGTIEHNPWSLQRGWIDIHRNDCFRANGLPRPDADPLVHYSDGTDFNIGIIRPISPDRMVSSR
jgi:uncharacterized protein YqjF (DUF2071 family)